MSEKKDFSWYMYVHNKGQLESAKRGKDVLFTGKEVVLALDDCRNNIHPEQSYKLLDIHDIYHLLSNSLTWSKTLSQVYS